MNRMEIDEGIREPIRILWRHGYKTIHSCEGHEPSNEEPQGTVRYVAYQTGTGDGWFEKNAHKLGFIGFLESKLKDPASGKKIDAISYYSRD